MLYATQRAVSDGTLQLLALTISFFDKSEIAVFLNSVPTTAFTWATDTSLHFNSVVPNGVEVLVRRSTDLSKPRHVFTDGAQFNAKTLDEDFTQILHASQEAVEGATIKDLFQDLNMHGFRITNAAPAIDDADLISLGQVKLESESSFTAAADAHVAQAAAEAAQAAAAASLAASQALATVIATNQRPNIRNYGALGNGVADDTAAFNTADTNYTTTGDATFLPPGTYVVSALPTSKFYGPGVVKFGAELFYLDNAISSRINVGPPTPIDPENPDQLARYFNLVAGSKSGAGIASTDARANTIYGSEAMTVCPIPARITGFGKQVFKLANTLYSSDAFGADALGQGDLYSRCAGFGANTLKWAGAPNPVTVLHDYYRNTGTGDGDFLTATLLNAADRWPTIRADFVGTITTPNPAHIAASSNDVNQSVAVGRNALLHTLKSDGNTAIGVNALAHSLDTSNNTAVGVRAGRDCVSGIENVFLGASAGMQNMSGKNNVAIGYSALLSGSHTSFNVAIGYRAAASLVGTDLAPNASPSARRNTYIGTQAGENSTNGSFNVGIGPTALRAVTGGNNVAVGSAALVAMTTGSFNTAIGSNAQVAVTTGGSNISVGFESLVSLTTGSQNTAVGYQSGRFDTVGATANFTNAATFGYQAYVSASNQVQLGNSATTTYVYGTVQNRSDARDKTDVRDTSLGLDFIMGLRAVEGRWDLREDYYEEVDGVRVPLEKDGSKARTRYHQWFLAQEVKALCDSLGVDFGGYQNHADCGGADVMSLGYDEFIPPVIKAIQDINASVERRFAALEARLAELEAK